MAQPRTVALTQELEQIQAGWLKALRTEQDLIYSRDFGPLFAPLFARLPLDGWKEPRPQFKALISIVGLSWQPVALMTAWVKPEQVLLLGTRESLGMKVGAESVAAIVSRLSGIPHERFEAKEVQDTELELGIYKVIMDFVRQHHLRPEDVAVDPTGGKKSMSASAALAGFLTGARLMYVDYAEYHSQNRIPVAGTEYPRLLRNPLEVFGVLEFGRIKTTFNEGSYEEAWHLADALVERLYEPREAEGLALLAKAYGAWHRFAFEESVSHFQKLSHTLDCFGRFGRWNWCETAFRKLNSQLPVITELARLSERICAGELPTMIEEGFPLILNHVAAAKRYLQQDRPGAAILLIYATVEKYVDLCLWVFFGVKDEDPDYSKLNFDMETFHKIGRSIHGKKYIKRDPGGPITLSLGIQLLAVLKPELVPAEFYGPLLGIMNDRNKCEFEHGLCAKALSRQNVEKHIQTTEKLLEIPFKNTNCPKLLESSNYEFPKI